MNDQKQKRRLRLIRLSVMTLGAVAGLVAAPEIRAASFWDRVVSFMRGNAPVITTSAIPGGGQGQTVSLQLTEVGGKQPYRWSLAGGALPLGVNLSSGGFVSGTLKAGATTSATVRVTDNRGQSGQKSFTTTVTCPGKLHIVQSTADGSPFRLPDYTVGVPYGYDLGAYNDPPPVTCPPLP